MNWSWLMIHELNYTEEWKGRGVWSFRDRVSHNYVRKNILWRHHLNIHAWPIVLMLGIRGGWVNDHGAWMGPNPIQIKLCSFPLFGANVTWMPMSYTIPCRHVFILFLIRLWQDCPTLLSTRYSWKFRAPIVWGWKLRAIINCVLVMLYFLKIRVDKKNIYKYI